MKRYKLVDPYNTTIGHIELEDGVALSLIDRKPQLNLGYVLTTEDDDLIKFILGTVTY